MRSILIHIIGLGLQCVYCVVVGLTLPSRRWTRWNVLSQLCFRVHASREISAPWIACRCINSWTISICKFVSRKYEQCNLLAPAIRNSEMQVFVQWLPSVLENTTCREFARRTQINLLDYYGGAEASRSRSFSRCLVDVGKIYNHLTRISDVPQHCWEKSSS